MSCSELIWVQNSLYLAYLAYVWPIYFLSLPIIFLSDVLPVGLPMAVGGALGIGGSTISVSASSSLAQQPHSMGAGARFRGVSRRFRSPRAAGAGL